MTNKNDKILAPIKGRIIQFIENQGEKKEFFFKELNVASSNFRGQALFSEVSAEIVAKILSKYPNLSSEWLLLDKGSMLKSEPQPAVSSSQPQENDNEIISLLRDKIALLESNNQLQQDKIAYLEQRLELAELKDKEAMALKIKKQRKEIDQKDEIINLQNEELDAMKSISLPPNKPLHPSKRV